MRSERASGIINVLKPAGISSNAVLSKVKKALNIKKVGHLGTLDPLGTGVLPVCVGKATRLFDYYLNKDKVYRTVFVFGKTTDTLDSEGLITNQNDVLVSKNDLLNILPEFVGKMDQMPPMYSAKKINGKKAYELARENKEVVLKPKQIEIYNIKLIEELQQNTFLLEVHCSSGTYIRSLARDIGNFCDSSAYLVGLLRTKVGNFKLEDAVGFEYLSDFTINSVLQNLKTEDEKIKLDKDVELDLQKQVKG